MFIYIFIFYLNTFPFSMTKVIRRLAFRGGTRASYWTTTRRSLTNHRPTPRCQTNQECQRSDCQNYHHHQHHQVRWTNYRLLNHVMPWFNMVSFLNHVKEAEGQKEEETEGRKKARSTGTSMPGTDAPTGSTRSGVSDARNRRKHGRWCGVLLHRRSRGG